MTKLPTFAAARCTLLDGLTLAGWSVSRGLKIPHATSPDGSVRLWFKPQAVHFTLGSNAPGSHHFGDARSVMVDMRTMTVDQLLTLTVNR